MFSNKSHTASSLAERKKFLESLSFLENTLFYVVLNFRITVFVVLIQKQYLKNRIYKKSEINGQKKFKLFTHCFRYP